jgi:hypothetical protein
MAKHRACQRLFKGLGVINCVKTNGMGQLHEVGLGAAGKMPGFRGNYGAHFLLWKVRNASLWRN